MHIPVCYMTMSHNCLKGESMIKVIMKVVPSKTDYKTQHIAIKNWSDTMIKAHPTSPNIKIFSSKEIKQHDYQKLYETPNLKKH